MPTAKNSDPLVPSSSCTDIVLVQSELRRALSMAMLYCHGQEREHLVTAQLVLQQVRQYAAAAPSDKAAASASLLAFLDNFHV